MMMRIDKPAPTPKASAEAERAERDRQRAEWMAEALDAIRDMSGAITAEDLRERMVPPGHPSWFGAAMKRAAAAKILVPSLCGHCGEQTRRPITRDGTNRSELREWWVR